MTDINERIKQYVFVRDRIREMNDAHEQKLVEWNVALAHLSGVLQKFLDTNGLDSLKSEHGTCYKTTKYSASLADPDAFMRYVIANQKFELLDRRANVTAVKEFVKENKEQPPGCNLSAVETVGVRRPTK
jgi:hypothetical protein